MLKRRNFLKDQSIRSYAGDRFRNPYFQRGTFWTKWKIMTLVCLLLIFLFGTIGAIIYGPWFKIRNVNISGLSTVPETEVKSTVDAKLGTKRIYFLPNNHRWLFDSQELQVELQERFQFSTCDVVVQDRTLSISVQEKISAIAWQTGDRYYLLGLNGQPTIELDTVTANTLRSRQELPLLEVDSTLNDRAPLVLSPNMPIIVDESNTPISLETLVLKPETVTVIIDWDKRLRDASNAIPIDYEIETPATVWLTMNSSIGPVVLIDLQANIEEQGRALEIIINDYADRLADLKSIDVRFGNNVFVK
jgi:hypothetical protein